MSRRWRNAFAYKTPMLMAIMTPSFSFKVILADQMINQGINASMMSITPE